MTTCWRGEELTGRWEKSRARPVEVLEYAHTEILLHGVVALADKRLPQTFAMNAGEAEEQISRGRICGSYPANDGGKRVSEANPLDRFVSLQDVQAAPEILATAGISTLAWLTHEAEYADDDLTFIAIQNVLVDRPSDENRIYRDEYRRLWPEHAKARNYG